MGRRRAYQTAAVVDAARDAFWQRGYELTSIGDLETCTGLDRSSLYHAFGSKRGLFEAALRAYLEEAITSRLGGMREPTAGLVAIVAFFEGMAHTFRAEPDRARYGCLMVNTLGELGGHGPHAALARAYLDSFRDAFGTALAQAAARGEVDQQRVEARTNLLIATTLGLFTAARIDPVAAAEVCQNVAAEVAGWQTAGPRSRRRREAGRPVRG
jgi:TetR/AcrR family transcriptional regulator, transcriptional repressor for nem operon